jgi:hypothetical protein
MIQFRARLFTVPLSCYRRFQARLLQAKVGPKYLASDRCTQLAPILHGVIVVNTRIDPRPEDFVHKVARIVKRMGVKTILKRHAIHHDMGLRRTKVARDQCIVVLIRS